MEVARRFVTDLSHVISAVDRSFCTGISRYICDITRERNLGNQKHNNTPIKIHLDTDLY